MAFLVAGGVGLLLLVIALVVGEIDLGLGDVDGPFPLPGLPGAVTVLIALAGGLVVAGQPLNYHARP